MRKRTQSGPGGRASGPFVPGALVVVSLTGPREKFWGMLLDIAAAGLSVRGLDLNSLEDFLSRLRSGEPAVPSEVFFPMHRVERVELDSRNGDLPALAERFQTASGHSPAEYFGLNQSRSVPSR